jgi:hypothetical protein
MSQAAYKICPRCGTQTALQSPRCASCGRVYNTQFGPAVPQATMIADPVSAARIRSKWDTKRNMIAGLVGTVLLSAVGLLIAVRGQHDSSVVGMWYSQGYEIGPIHALRLNAGGDGEFLYNKGPLFNQYEKAPLNWATGQGFLRLKLGNQQEYRVSFAVQQYPKSLHVYYGGQDCVYMAVDPETSERMMKKPPTDPGAME